MVADGQLLGATWLDLKGNRRAQLASIPLLLAERWPPVLRHFSQPAQRRALRDLLAFGRFAVVIADTPYATGALPRRRPGAPPRSHIPLVVNTHNVEREVWQSATADVSGGRARLALDRLSSAAGKCAPSTKPMA